METPEDLELEELVGEAEEGDPKAMEGMLRVAEEIATVNPERAGGLFCLCVRVLGEWAERGHPHAAVLLSRLFPDRDEG